MTVKIFKSIFITAMAVLLLAAIIISAFTYRYHNRELETEISRECRYIATGYERFGVEYLRGIETDGSEIMLISPDGVVLFSASLTDDVAAIPNQSEMQEIIEALDTGSGSDVRGADSHARTVYYAMRTSDGNIIRVAAQHEGAMKIFTGALLPILVLLAAVAVVAVFVSNGLAHSVVRPINELDLEHPEDAKVYDELKPIAKKLSYQNYKISKQMDELRIRENEFNSITSNMSEGMIVINSNTVILSCNESAKRILGITDKIPHSLLSLRNTREFYDAVLSALSGKPGYDTLRTEDKFYSIIITPVHNVDEELKEDVTGAVIFIIDETEKENREALRREFTSNISHELKTPLTSISGFAELVRDGVTDEDDTKRFAANIHREAQRLIVLVGDIIKLSRLDGGEIDCDERVDLYEIACEVTERLANVAERAGITLSVTGGEAFVNGNPDTLEEMIYNLTDNGIKYGKAGGFVKIGLSSTDTDTVLTVADNGIGIPNDKQDRVFERFYRVDKSHSKEIGGTGLGLSIVKHAAMCHKATISLESTYGEGTEITIRFPKFKKITEK